MLRFLRGAKSYSMMTICNPIMKAMANAWKLRTTPLMRPRFAGGNHSQASKNDDNWNMQVPTAENTLCMTINTQTLDQMMKEIDPDRMQTQLRHKTALIGMVNINLAAMGMKRPAEISILK
jgi:hypothetical protein